MFPPKKINYLDKRSAGNFISLLKNLEQKSITLILGSGVSASIGIPTWDELIKRICITFFDHWEFRSRFGLIPNDLPPKNLSIGGATDEILWDEELETIAEEFSKTGDPLLIIQQIKNCIRPRDWRYLLNKSLYSDNSVNENSFKSSMLMEELAGFCNNCDSVESVINYNYDNSFEYHLKNNGKKYISIWEPRTRYKNDTLKIYYPHGYLPLNGGPKSDIVLSEDDYNELYSNPYSWQTLIQTRSFSSTLCVFIGVSMTDPNQRRMLRLCSKINPEMHYTFLSKSKEETRKEMMYNILFDNDLYNIGIKKIRYAKIKTKNRYKRLTDLVKIMNLHLNNNNVLFKN
jgi:hypothetical protein